MQRAIGQTGTRAGGAGHGCQVEGLARRRDLLPGVGCVLTWRLLGNANNETGLRI